MQQLQSKHERPQGTYIRSVLQRNNPVAIFTRLLHSIIQLCHRRLSILFEVHAFARALSKRHVVHTSFIWAGPAFIFHAVQVDRQDSQLAPWMRDMVCSICCEIKSPKRSRKHIAIPFYGPYICTLILSPPPL